MIISLIYELRFVFDRTTKKEKENVMERENEIDFFSFPNASGLCHQCNQQPCLCRAERAKMDAYNPIDYDWELFNRVDPDEVGG